MENKPVLSPYPIDESWFFRADYIQCYCSNTGISHLITEVPVVRIKDLHSFVRRKKYGI